MSYNYSFCFDWQSNNVFIHNVCFIFKKIKRVEGFLQCFSLSTSTWAFYLVIKSVHSDPPLPIEGCSQDKSSAGNSLVLRQVGCWMNWGRWDNFRSPHQSSSLRGQQRSLPQHQPLPQCLHPLHRPHHLTNRGMISYIEYLLTTILFYNKIITFSTLFNQQ